MTPTTQPRILCRAGASRDSMSAVAVNSGEGIAISTDDFEGSIAVRIKDYLGPKSREGPRNPAHGFSEAADTWSVQIQGRFKKEGVSADEVLWGNSWDRPIRDYLPYGTAAGLKFANYMDPALTHDLYADKPWALSPLLSTMQFVDTQSVPASSPVPKWVDGPVKENLKALADANPGAAGLPVDHPNDRRKYFVDENNRKKVEINKDVVFTADFTNGFIDFNTLGLKLPIGLSFSLAKYWNGEPVVFECRRRSDHQAYFYVSFTIDEGAEEVVGDNTDAKKAEEEDSKDVD